MSANGEYQYLKPKRGSRYQQLFYGRIRPKSCTARRSGVNRLKNKELLDAERAREDEEIRASGYDKWPYAPKAEHADA